MEKQADMITKRTLILLICALLTCSVAHADPGGKPMSMVDITTE